MSSAEMTCDAPCINGAAKTVLAVLAAEAPRAAVPCTTKVASTAHSRTLPEICYTLRRKVTAFLDQQPDGKLARDTQTQARVAMGVIEEALRSYSHEEISLAYNGGKDCLVLLVLILACLPAIFPPSASSPVVPVSIPSSGPDTSGALSNMPSEQHEQHNSHDCPPPKLARDQVTAAPSSSSPQPLQAIYIAPPDPFPEVEDFVATSTQEYNLDMVRYALPMRPALEAYIRDRPLVRAIFMGTRRTDPHSEFLTHFSPTDADWPQFMRVNPIIDWHYAEIWTFIRQLQVSYCCLYDRGFSSLGGMTNTRPNPALALNPEGRTFRPAYELVRDDEERLGRDR